MTSFSNQSEKINSILDFRNQDMLKSNGIHLHRIAEDNSRETQAMADTAKHTYNDSRTMRIATVIALIYLPANLVLVRVPDLKSLIQKPPEILSEVLMVRVRCRHFSALFLST